MLPLPRLWTESIGHPVENDISDYLSTKLTYGTSTPTWDQFFSSTGFPGMVAKHIVES